MQIETLINLINDKYLNKSISINAMYSGTLVNCYSELKEDNSYDIIGVMFQKLFAEVDKKLIKNITQDQLNMLSDNCKINIYNNGAMNLFNEDLDHLVCIGDEVNPRILGLFYVKEIA